MSKDLEILESFYSPRLKSFGAGSAASVGFDDDERRKLRWKILVEGTSLSEVKKILDIGCGLAHMSEFLNGNGFHGSYHGFEALESFVTEGKKQYPNCDIRKHNYINDRVSETFDCIVSNGLFTLNTPNHWENLSIYLSRCFEMLDNNGVLAFNLFPDDVNFTDPQFAYFNIGKVIDLISKHTRSYIVRRDYLQFDVTFYCYKRG